MEWWGPSRQIEQFDEGDTLVIRVTSVQRKGDYAILCAVTAAGVLAGLTRNNGSVVVVAMVFGGFVGWILSLERVTEMALNANGVEWQNGGRWSKKRILLWKDVYGLRYETGDDGPGGMFARTGRWTSTCLVSGLNRSDSEAIMRMIDAKFPTRELAPEPEGLLSSFKKALRG